MKMQFFVMPAWIASIQVRKDASGNIHVSLDSSTPCWNDAIEGVLHELTEVIPSLFSNEPSGKLESDRQQGRILDAEDPAGRG